MRALCQDPGATLDDLREAVTKLEDVERTARQVLGGAHPTVFDIEVSLRTARTALRARADEMHDTNKGMTDLVKFFAAIKPYDGGKETE